MLVILRGSAVIVDLIHAFFGLYRQNLFWRQVQVCEVLVDGVGFGITALVGLAHIHTLILLTILLRNQIQ